MRMPIIVVLIIGWSAQLQLHSKDRPRFGLNLQNYVESTIPGVTLAGIEFASDDTLVVSACVHPQDCELIALKQTDKGVSIEPFEKGAIQSLRLRAGPVRYQ